LQYTASTASTATEAIQRDQQRLETLINTCVDAKLEGEFQLKKKEFDGQQHAFYRRISSAEDQQVERLNELESKFAAAKDQINELGTKASNFELQVTDACDQHKARTSDLDERTNELDAKESHVDNMYSKVSGMIKAAETSASKMKELAKSSIATINQARSSLVESALPFLKNPVLDMVASAVHDLQFTSLSKFASVSPPTITETPKSNALESLELNEEDEPTFKSDRKQSLQKRKTPTKNQLTPSSSSGEVPSKRQRQSTVKNASDSKSKKRKAPQPKARSPFAPLNVVNTSSSPGKKASNIELLFSPAQCVPPLEKDSTVDFSARSIGVTTRS